MKISDAITTVKDLALVEFMEEVQTLLNNGLGEMRVVTSVPSWQANDGETAIYYSGDNRQLYFFVNGMWASIGFSSTGSLSMFDVDGDTGITPELFVNDNILRFYTAGFYNFSMTTEGFSVANALKVIVRSNDTYMYSSAAGYLALVAGTQIGLQANTLVTGNLTVGGGYGFYGDGTNLTGLSGFFGDSVPIGSELTWAGSSGSVPVAYLYCDGTSLLRAGTYSALFAAIGTTYGSDDASHFNIPNAAGFIIKAVAGTATLLGISGGGTGQATAQAAIDALTTVSSATNEYVLTKDTATGNAIFKASGGVGNVLFQWHGSSVIGASGSDRWGAIVSTVSATPTGGDFTLSYHSLAVFGDAADRTVLSTKFKKIAGINTVTVYAYARKDSGTDNGKIQVDVGGQTGSVSTVLGSSSGWVNFTVDVSSLTDGTVYDVSVQLNPNQSGKYIYLYDLIAFGS